jgi:hypothetical protein
MKKLALIIALVAILTSCESPVKNVEHTTQPNVGYNIVVIDSCEYIEVDYGIFDQRIYSLTHKGNCKFCAERQRKMIREEIERMPTSK